LKLIITIEEASVTEYNPLSLKENSFLHIYLQLGMSVSAVTSPAYISGEQEPACSSAQY